MKIRFPIRSLAVFIFASVFFTGCIKDTCHRIHTYSYYIPVYKTTQEVKNNIKSGAPTDVQNPGKIFILGNYIFLNEVDKGIHIIDNSNPASPQNAAFIAIPGNMDIAVKGNILYADVYTDMVAIDISDPLHIVVKKYNEGVFPFRSYNNGFIADSGKIISDWIKRDTTVTEDCGGYSFVNMDSRVFFMSSSSSSSPSSASPVGIGGSMARFALVNNYLYTVDDTHLNIFNITSGADPVWLNKVSVGWQVETIYPFKNKLFIGSNNGMFIYNVASSPANPVKAGEFAHARACDPVIADDNFAYVTLHSGTPCLGFTNQLDIIKLNNLVDATLAKTYTFTSPQGLSKEGNILFVCDGAAGLKIYNASNLMNLQLITEFVTIETYDVIANNNIALVVAKDGLYQYDYSDLNNIHQISKTVIVK